MKREVKAYDFLFDKHNWKHFTILEKPITPANDAQPPWVKEMEKKKSSFTREDIKPEVSAKKEPIATSSQKPVS